MLRLHLTSQVVPTGRREAVSDSELVGADRFRSGKFSLPLFRHRGYLC